MVEVLWKETEFPH